MSEIHDPIASEDQERAQAIDNLRTADQYLVFACSAPGQPIQILSWLAPLALPGFLGALTIVTNDLKDDLAAAMLSMIQDVEIDDDGHSKKV